MSSTFRYVKEFEFPSAKNYCYGGKAMKKATGGDVTVNEKGERLYVSRPASQTTAVSTTATKTLSKKEQRQALKAQEKSAKEAQRMANRHVSPTTKPGTTSATTTTTAAKARGGVMKKADGGSVRPALRAASQPLPTRQYSSDTRQYTPAENQQRALARRAQMDKKDAARQAAHDARVSAAKKLEAVKEADNAARKGMNVPGTEANKLKLAGKLSDKKGTGSVTRPATSTGTTASAAMAKAHGGVAHKAMTKKSRGGVPAHSNTPMIKKASGGYVASPPQREGMSYNPGPMPAKKSRR